MSTPHVPGCVSMYEEHLTRREAGYLLHEWYELTPKERALEIAVRRSSNLIEALQLDKLEAKK